MDIVNNVNWFMIIGSSDDKQILYFFNRPIYTFPKIKEVKNSTVIMVPSKNAVWTPINIELPTRLLKNTENWMNDKSKVNLIVKCIGNRGVNEEWVINGAQVINFHLSRSRVIDAKVVNVNVKYEWARKIK